MKNYILALALISSVCILGGQQSLAEEASYAFIVNADSGVTETTAKEMKALLLGQTKKLGDVQLKLVMQSPTSDGMDAAIRSACGKSASQFRNYWVKKVFSGRGIAPSNVESKGVALNFVASNPKSVALIAALGDTAVPDGVVVVTIQ